MCSVGRGFSAMLWQFDARAIGPIDAIFFGTACASNAKRTTIWL
jgi:hypothetical protein